MTDKTPSSPDGLELRSAPLSSARLSRKAVFAVIAVLAVVMGVVIANVSKGKSVKAGEQVGGKELQPALNAAKDLTKDVPDVVAPPPQRSEPPPAASGSRAPVKSLEDDARFADTAVAKFGEGHPSGIQPDPAAASAESPVERERLQDETAADRQVRGNYGAEPDEPPIRGNSDMAFGGNRRFAAGGFLRTAEPLPAGEPDLNRQAEKRTFLRQSMPSGYLNSQLKAPLSPFELKAGTVIPTLLLTAMNSDLPGEIIGQVAQNVYDTATGKYLLIPQGSRLFGHYDANVTFGQGRVLISWQRLAYPNAYTLDLGGMSGHDAAGQAGLADRVNHHYGRIFGWALLTSAISAGYQLSQPQQGNALGTTVPSNAQVAAGAVGQQMAQLGSQIASRNMQVQPTIEIRKGYRLNVMVNKDIVFPASYTP